jgi:hypothetical protein
VVIQGVDVEIERVERRAVTSGIVTPAPASRDDERADHA